MRRMWIAFMICLVILADLPQASASNCTAYNKAWIERTPVHVVTVNLNSPNVRVSPAVARHGVGSSEGFGSMLSRLQPSAAITGTYFCVRSLIPVGDIVIDNRLVNFGVVGTGVCITADNRIDFRPIRRPRLDNWAGYSSVICTGPRLVRDGIPYVSPWSEGFSDPGLFRQARRSALGVTRNNKLLLVTVNRPIYLSKLAKIMRGLGAVDAVALDGGTSTALYCKGKVPSHPGRRLTNLLLIYESPTKFAKIKDSLAPAPVVAQTSSKT